MRYQVPPQEALDILDAPALPLVFRSPQGEWLAMGYRRNLPRIRELSEPMLRLAGRRVNPRTNGPYQVPEIVRLSVVSVADGRERPVEGVDGELGYPLWAPGGDRFAVPRTVAEGIELWVVDAATGEARRVVGPELNLARGDGCVWMPDGRRLICHLFDPDRGKAPMEPVVPLGPTVQESGTETSPARTYQDLLEDAHDEALYEHYLTSQPVLVDVQTGDQRRFGKPAIYESLRASPDGRYFLSITTVRPYSYLVPDGRFTKRVEIWDGGGERLREVALLPLDESGPEQLGFRRAGARSFGWQPTGDATLVFVEALDDGDPERDVPHRDRILTLPAPFDGAPDELARTEHRAGSGPFGRGPEMFWCASGRDALVFEYDWSTRNTRSWLASLDGGASPGSLSLLWSRSADDWYGDPGRPLTTTTTRGEVVVHQSGDRIFLVGEGGSPEGDRPFLDSFDLRTRERKRLFHCAPESYEFVAALLDEAAQELLVRHETPAEPPNWFVVDRADGSRRAVTSFRHPQPGLLGVEKRRIHYERSDGVPLSGDLYLPATYQEEEKLPVLVWAYPREYVDEAGAGQVRGSPNRFVSVRGASQLLFLTQGYAVLDGASMPIIGGLRANDTYVAQLVANGEAAVGKLLELGIAEEGRIGIAGHSYGAFMTANMLAHSDGFAAGIARSGAFNRSLTPFGFQTERRSFWDAPEVYQQMSPFMHADKIQAPLLLIHGMIDANPGTFPIQSERLYHALKGLGRSARLVLLPNESHGYRARESVLHTVWEMFEWMNRHLKGSGPAPRPPGGSPSGSQARPL